MKGVEAIQSGLQEALLPANDGRGAGLQSLLMPLKEICSANIRMSLARKTYPAGKDRDWAMLLSSNCWSGVSQISLLVAIPS